MIPIFAFPGPDAFDISGAMSFLHLIPTRDSIVGGLPSEDLDFGRKACSPQPIQVAWSRGVGYLLIQRPC